MVVKLIENRSEIGGSKRGASMGIDALRVASLNKGSTFFRDNRVETIKDENHLLYQEINFPEAKRIEGVYAVFQTISNKVKTTLENGKFPIVLAGDHASAGGTIAGIKAAYPNKRLGVIWIDAHADLHSPYTSPSGNLHGMPLATAIAEDNKIFGRNEINKQVVEYWEKLKQCQGIAQKVMPIDIVFYGVRDTEPEEDALIERYGIKNFTVAECREKGIKSVCDEGLNILKDCDLLYLSFDVDSLDCNLASDGTGTPVAEGYSPEEANQMLNYLIESDKLACLEVTEINPTLDNKKNQMAEISFDILENSVYAISNK